jgi:hypothetical protein
MPTSSHHKVQTNARPAFKRSPTNNSHKNEIKQKAVLHPTAPEPTTSTCSWRPSALHAPNLRPPQTFSRTIHVIHPRNPPSYPPQATHTSCSAVRFTPCLRTQLANNTAAPPQPSKRELEAAEAQTMSDIKWTAASAVVLYFCECRMQGYGE